MPGFKKHNPNLLKDVLNLGNPLHCLDLQL